MAEKTIYWNTNKSLCCGDVPAEIFICTDFGVVEGILRESRIISTDDCNKSYRHKITYDTVSLVFEGAPAELANEDILDVSCQGCYSNWIRQEMENVLAGGDGWIAVPDIWQYLSSTSVTVPSGAASKYGVGTKVRFTQTGTVKYGTIVQVTDTTLSFAPNDDYAVADSALSNIAYSNTLNPYGFPHAFHFTSTQTGFSTPPVMVGVFTILARKLFLTIYNTALGTSNSNSFTASAPVPAANMAGMVYVSGGGIGTDNSAFAPNVFAEIHANSSTIILTRSGGSAGWTASGTKGANFQISYDI